MLMFDSSKIAFCALACLMTGEITRPAFAQQFATKWSGGQIINLGGLPGSAQSAALRNQR